MFSFHKNAGTAFLMGNIKVNNQEDINNEVYLYYKNL